MESAADVGLVIAVSLAGGIALWLVIATIARTVLRRVAARMTVEIGSRFAAHQVRRQEPVANFFGRESLGLGQVRGNGGLVLTDDELWFLLAVPRREVRIPRSAIETAEVRRSHLGKTIARDLLYVRWKTDEGVDAAAWWVPDAAAWVAALKG